MKQLRVGVGAAAIASLPVSTVALATAIVTRTSATS
jgi:hypothetical protein